MPSAGFHEADALLRPETKDRHRAIVSLMEELEAVDWYDQRVDAADDDDLRAVLAHNRDEEKEHAAMTLEWLRRHDPVWDAVLRTYLFTTVPITEVEEEVAVASESGAAVAPPAAPPGVGPRTGLGIGSLRGESL